MTETQEQYDTYFSAPERHFPTLQDGKIPTLQFLNACHGVGEFTAFLGTAFIPVKNDVLGNVEKVRKMYNTDPTEFAFLEDLILADLKAHNNKLGLATEGLLWLKRGLEFMLEMLTGLVEMHRTGNSSDSLYTLLSSCYERTLKHHHGFVSRQLFKVVLAAAPSRKSLIRTVSYGKDGMEDKAYEHMEKHIDNFKQCVHSLVLFYSARGLDRCYFQS
ncbi:Glycolipid transfer protein [Aphelenchoides besseyi]|nr:Glycolipid transfer protein [Aphelenchoides besseyi]